MYNKVKSTAIKGKRKPGRPFNTTSYPWRSTSIGRGFLLKNSFPPSGQMMTKLESEGFSYTYTLTPFGTLMTRID